MVLGNETKTKIIFALVIFLFQLLGFNVAASSKEKGSGTRSTVRMLNDDMVR